MADRDPSILHACTKAGGAKALADALGIHVSAVYQWKRIPAERVRDVVRLAEIPAHELRPDLYDDPAMVCLSAAPAGQVSA